VKVTYEVTNERIIDLLRHAAANNNSEQFSWDVRYIVQEAFEAGRDFQKRYKEEEE
jgi:hypothetical protein